MNWGPPRSQTRLLSAVRRAVVLAHSSTWTRRLIPAPLAFWAIDAFAWLARRAGLSLYEDNVRFHRQLLSHTALRGSECEVAQRAVREFIKCGEIFWRPWLMHRGEIEGIEVFEQARAERRGVVAVFPHFGMPYSQFPIMRRFGIDAWVVASPHHYDDIGDGYDARFARQGRSYVDLLGAGRGIARAEQGAADGIFPRVLELLRGGATVSIAFDIVGSMPTPFLGRRVKLTSGTARLAHTADSLVVPFVHRRRGPIPILKFGTPLDPRDFAEPADLQAAIAARMEAWALELPEAVWPLHTQPGGPPLIRGPEIGRA